jgi:hypothetical protein
LTTYAPNFTPRYKLHYIHGGITHSCQIRGARGDDQTVMTNRGNKIGDIFNLFDVTLKYEDLLAIGAEFAETDSDVFIPAAFTAIAAGSEQVADHSPMERIRGLTFNGAATGSRARFTLFGLIWHMEGISPVGGDGLILASEVPDIGAAAVLAQDNFRANSGLAAVFGPRATYKENDHLLKLVRRGIIA